MAPFEISPKYTCEMNWSRIPIFSISIMAVVVFLLLPFLTMEFLNIKLKHNHVVPSAEAGDLVIVESGLPSRPQQSAAELKARFLEQKLIDRSNQKILLEENAQRLKQILKESETSFVEIKQRKSVDPISFIKEASERGSMYLQIGDKQTAYHLYKEAVQSLRGTGSAIDTAQFEDPLWQFLLEYLKTVESKEAERDAIDRLLNASDRKQSIPYIGGSFRIADYFKTVGRQQEAVDFLIRIVGLVLKNRPEDVDSLTATSIELECISVGLKQQGQLEKVDREILAATEKYHPNQGASVIDPLARLSAFCIKNNQQKEGDLLAEKALILAKEDTVTCLLDKLAVIADSYTGSGKLDKAEHLLREAAEIKSKHFKTVELSYLNNSYRELKAKFEERGQWTSAESLLEQFKLAQVPGKYGEMCVLQDLFFGNLDEAGRLQSLVKGTEAQNSLKKADDAYLKVKEYFAKEQQASAVQDWFKTRQNRLKTLGLNDNLNGQ